MGFLRPSADHVADASTLVIFTPGWWPVAKVRGCRRTRSPRSTSSGSAAWTATRWPWCTPPRGSTTTQLQRFARWTGLSETAFLLPPTTDEADYRVRIFTPEEELPFAGHPTLGSAYAWLGPAGSPRGRPHRAGVRRRAGAAPAGRRPAGLRGSAADPVRAGRGGAGGRIAGGLGLRREGARRLLAGQRAAVARGAAGERRAGARRPAGRRRPGRPGSRAGRSVPAGVGDGVRGAGAVTAARSSPRTR